MTTRGERSVEVRERGVTLVELVLAMAVLLIMVGSALALIAAELRTSTAIAETERAVRAIESRLEEMRAFHPYGAGLYDSFTSGSNGAPLRFAVPGLVRADGSDAGETVFVDEATLVSATALPGIPADLDGNGATTDALTQAELRAGIAAGRIGAARITVIWRGTNGDRNETLFSILYPNQND